MNKIVNNFLSSGDKFFPGMYLRPPKFTYSTCESFTKIQKFKEAGDRRYIYIYIYIYIIHISI